MATNTVTNSSFDPYTQPFTILLPDGVTQVVTSVSAVSYLQQLASRSGIMFGSQIGMLSILLTILTLLTKPDKRRSAVFILNSLALVLLDIRTILMCIEVTSPLYNFYNWIAADYTHVQGALQVSAAAEVFDTLAIAAIELSMMFQVRIVCCTLKEIYRRAVTGMSIVMVLAVVSIRLVTMVVNIDWNIIHVASETEQQMLQISHLASVTNIVIMVSIIFFSAIFCGKLWHAIIERRKLGLKQFGPMQIIFVMGCQTLVIPAVFGILAYLVLKSSQINTFMPVIVATFLPLSSMWAATSSSNPNAAAEPRRQGGRNNIPLGRSEYETTTRSNSEKNTIPSSRVDTLIGSECDDSLKALAPHKFNHRATVYCDCSDLEMQRTHDQIQIDRTYCVRSE